MGRHLHHQAYAEEARHEVQAEGPRASAEGEQVQTENTSSMLGPAPRRTSTCPLGMPLTFSGSCDHIAWHATRAGTSDTSAMSVQYTNGS